MSDVNAMRRLGGLTTAPITAYDPDVLIAQFDAIGKLPPTERRKVGKVLVEYGEDIIDSADRLVRLQALLGPQSVRPSPMVETRE